MNKDNSFRAAKRRKGDRLLRFLLLIQVILVQIALEFDCENGEGIQLIFTT